MKILFASSEVLGFATTGGLGDVASALPLALAARRHEVVVVMPRYGSISRKNLKDSGKKISIAIGSRKLSAKILTATLGGNALGAKVKVCFIDQPKLYGSRPNPYGGESGDYPDNDERFIFFNRALLEVARELGFRPDIVHLNDWQCGLAPLYLQREREASKFFKKTLSVFTIHNLAYQGLFPKSSMRFTGLPESLFAPDGVEMYGKIAMMKSGILFADAVTAVSPTYAREILKPELGFGLESVLKKRRKDLHGILNGIDVAVWNPERDRLIKSRYSRKNLSPKQKCRAGLLREFGLEDGADRPVVGMVTRFVEQKGIDIIMAAGDALMELGLSLVVLGSGQREFEKYFNGLQKRFPRRVGVKIGYDNALSHRIESASDIFLMPSRFEPCGLNQMYSLRYGTIPVVRSTGGLADTVRNFNGKSGNGFTFKKPDATPLLRALGRAVKTYSDKALWRSIMEEAMKEDFSWDKSAKLYLRLYRDIRR